MASLLGRFSSQRTKFKYELQAAAPLGVDVPHATPNATTTGTRRTRQRQSPSTSTSMEREWHTRAARVLMQELTMRHELAVARERTLVHALVNAETRAGRTTANTRSAARNFSLSTGCIVRECEANFQLIPLPNRNSSFISVHL